MSRLIKSEVLSLIIDIGNPHSNSYSIRLDNDYLRVFRVIFVTKTITVVGFDNDRIVMALLLFVTSSWTSLMVTIINYRLKIAATKGRIQALV